MLYNELQKMITTTWNMLADLEKQYRHHNDNRNKYLNAKAPDAITLENERCRFINKKQLDLHNYMKTLIDEKKTLYGCDHIVCPEEHVHEDKND